MDYLTIIFRVIGVVVVTLGVLPKARREARIKDGILAIRKMIYLTIIAYMISAVALLILSVERVFFQTANLVPSLSLLNGIETTTVSTILYLLYSKKYGDEQK